MLRSLISILSVKCILAEFPEGKNRNLSNPFANWALWLRVRFELVQLMPVYVLTHGFSNVKRWSSIILLFVDDQARFDARCVKHSGGIFHQKCRELGWSWTLTIISIIRQSNAKCNNQDIMKDRKSLRKSYNKSRMRENTRITKYTENFVSRMCTFDSAGRIFYVDIIWRI